MRACRQLIPVLPVCDSSPTSASACFLQAELGLAQGSPPNLEIENAWEFLGSDF
jgi:hypothetical protein